MSVPYSRAHTALRATGIVCVCLGFGTSAQLSRLPDVCDDLGLTPTTISTMLLIASLDSLLTLPISGPIMTRIGARASSCIGVLTWAFGTVCARMGTLNASIPLATLGFMLLAAGNGLQGAAMDIEASLVQAAVRRTIVPIIQAIYAAGMSGGAFLGTLVSRIGMPLGAHLFGLTAPELLTCDTTVDFYLVKEEIAILAPTQDKGDGGEAASSKTKGLTRVTWREKQTVLITLMVTSAGLTEGMANDWLNLSMVDGYGYSTTAVSAAFAFFLLMMTAVRSVSPHLGACLGSPMLLRIIFSGAVVGLLLVAFALHHLFAVVGIALWGIGSALGFSLGISALSVNPVTTPARVSMLSTVNYGATLVGPPLLDLIADHIGYHHALAFMALPILLAIVLAGQMPDRRGTKRTDLAFGDQKAASRACP